MAVAEYRQQVLYTGPQVALLRRLSTGWQPSLREADLWQCIDRLWKKGALTQCGNRLLLTERGRWAVGRGTKRVVVSRRREHMDEENVLQYFEPSLFDMEELEVGGEVRAGDMDEAMFNDLVHDCVDYYKDNSKLPEPQDVQAWGEVVYAKVTLADARRVVKAAEKEIGNG